MRLRRYYYPPGMGHFGAAPMAPPNAPGVPAVMAPMEAPVGAQSMQEAGSIPNDQENRFWFAYQTPNIASLAPGGSTSNSIQFDNDSVFEWVKLTYSVDVSNAAQTNSSIVIPFVTVQIQDTGQGAYYSNAGIPLQSYAGDSRLPFVLPAPQFIQPNASLQFNYTSYSTAGGGNQTYNNLRLQLHGFKLKLK